MAAIRASIFYCVSSRWSARWHRAFQAGSGRSGLAIARIRRAKFLNGPGHGNTELAWTIAQGCCDLVVLRDGKFSGETFAAPTPIGRSNDMCLKFSQVPAPCSRHENNLSDSLKNRPLKTVQAQVRGPAIGFHAAISGINSARGCLGFSKRVLGYSNLLATGYRRPAKLGLVF